MPNNVPDFKIELFNLLKAGCQRWLTILSFFAVGLAIGILYVSLIPQIYKTSQVAYYKLDLDHMDFNITEIYSTLTNSTKDLCDMGQVYDFKMRKRFVIDQFASTVTFVTHGSNASLNIDCVKSIVTDVSENIGTIDRFKQFFPDKSNGNLEPFKVLTEPLTIAVLTPKLKALVVLAFGLISVGIWLFVVYVKQFLHELITRYRKVRSE